MSKIIKDSWFDRILKEANGPRGAAMAEFANLDINNTDQPATVAASLKEDKAKQTYFVTHWHCLRCNHKHSTKVRYDDQSKPNLNFHHDLLICEHCAGDPKYTKPKQNNYK